MFRFPKPLDVVTLFHNPHKPASIRIYNLLKKISAQATADSANNGVIVGSPSRPIRRAKFELNTTTALPTDSQLATILGYIGEDNAWKVVENAKDTENAIELLNKWPEQFIAPVTVDWNQGKAIAGDDESSIIRMLEEDSVD